MPTMLMSFKNILLIYLVFHLSSLNSTAQIPNANPGGYKLYPKTNNRKPDLLSPFIYDGNEYVIALTKRGKYAIMNVTLSNTRGICPQLIIDTLDFPELAQNGLHSEENLLKIKTITGWSVDTITSLGQPGGLSHSGFMAAGEDIISLVMSDNSIVKQLKLTHPEMAKPLFHVLNMMDNDLALNRWNMAIHQWENIQSFFYKGQLVNVIAYDTKGGQRSIFNDGIQGAFHVKLWRVLNESEMKYLKKHYGHLTHEEFDHFVELLSSINISEMQPQYIMRYGFYEGHTFWRAEPLAIACIFSLKSVKELDEQFNHQLHNYLTKQYRFL